MTDLKRLKGRVFSKIDMACQQFAIDLAEEIWRTLEAYLEEESRGQLQEAVEKLLALLEDNRKEVER